MHQIYSNLFFKINKNIHDYDVRNADDIHIPYGRIDIKIPALYIFSTSLR